MTDDTAATGAPAPRANPELIGQAAAERVMLAAWRSGRMPHAWLIGGPRGVGKATLAYRFARFVLAGGGDAVGGLFGASGLDSLALPTGHSVFRHVAAGAHPDLVTVERQINPETRKLRGEIIVDDIRDAGQFLHLTPVEGGWRAVIVDAADDMNLNAANALLKALEEPPRQALLLLVCHAPGRLLATIRSRCRYLALPPLSDEHVARLLDRFRPGLAEDDRAALVALADGSIGRALDLADRGGIELYREMVALLARGPDIDVPAVYAFADGVARGGSDAAAGFRTAMELLAAWVERLARAASGASTGSEIIAGEGAVHARLAGSGGVERWIACWDKINLLARRTESLNLDRRLVLIDAIVTLADAHAPRSSTFLS